MGGSFLTFKPNERSNLLHRVSPEKDLPIQPKNETTKSSRCRHHRAHR